MSDTDATHDGARFLPVNAILALCGTGDVYPAPLRTLGFVVAGLEVPVHSADGPVVIDVVLFAAARNRILAVEAKSGANVRDLQAGRYTALSADAVIQAASITVSNPGKRTVQPLYVCTKQHVDRIVLGLAESRALIPALAVGSAQIQHHGSPFADQELAAAFAQPIPVPSAPPRFIAVDAESSDEACDRVVSAALVAALSRRTPDMSVTSLAELAVRHLPMYGQAARNRIIRKVEAAVRRAGHRDPATFEYLGRGPTRPYSVVRFLRTPEDAARQGRTQSYQALARAAGKRVETPHDQMSLFDDLIEESESGTAGDQEEQG